jgi:hypothetical protein
MDLKELRLKLVAVTTAIVASTHPRLSVAAAPAQLG